MAPNFKKRKSENGDAKDVSIAELTIQVSDLKEQLALAKNYDAAVYASELALRGAEDAMEIPAYGRNPRHVKEYIASFQELDNRPRLNTSSYVNVFLEDEEREVAALGASVNLADGSVYPSSVVLHDKVVDWIARMWHCPEPEAVKDLALTRPNHFSGSGTVGSTEACLLAGLAHKFRWRRWYAARHNMTPEQVLGVRPNLVMTSVFQAAWEKFFRYFDVEPRFVKPSIKNFKVIPEDIYDLCDDKTMAVVGVLGNHYNGAYDPIWEMDKVIAKLNKDKGFQIGIHVDAASGGFVAPFQDNMPPFDFRLDNVLSMSTSGHKFGESICGTGWVVFRQREDLTEHIAISVSYLGGKCDSITLNFSRPASGCYVQLYKLLRLGKEGYRNKVDNQMEVAAFLRHKLMEMKRPDGKPRFEILDTGDDSCLPVVGARLNNADGSMNYDDIDLQHALAESHWYVSGYGLSFENPANGTHESLFRDADKTASMFRVVVKSNLTKVLAVDLVRQINDVLPVLDKHGFKSVKSAKFHDADKGTMALHHKAC